MPAKPGFFVYGNNFGYTPGWDNHQKADLAKKLAARGNRITLPQAFLAKWGTTIAIDNGDMAAYAAAGLVELTS